MSWVLPFSYRDAEFLDVYTIEFCGCILNQNMGQYLYGDEIMCITVDLMKGRLYLHDQTSNSTENYTLTMYISKDPEL